MKLFVMACALCFMLNPMNFFLLTIATANNQFEVQLVLLVLLLA